ncbi:helix-turn-helix transcriptional regulator [Oceanobacillus halophilus]|uniref:DeoR family transcriptional regulator n=1 Tax=Oceanobacillus halophilus TaxID=930130 RepID=A0A494ZTR4_9BACI|nr:DeoR family transcriptional regulator [Oceanobacillus halophilus]RKQ29600.1 DeoR family transcriptional regulator [Oceanobacillus halophilus]
MNKQTPPKRKLLNILKKNHAMTIGNIMEHFTISEVAVRKHLHELEKQGLLKKISHKQNIGRPYLTYELTEKGHSTFPNQYQSLPVELLKDLEELQGEQAVYDLLEKRMQREKAYFESNFESSGLEEKINQVAQIQNENGYMVEIEKTEQGDYEIRNYNCPISNIASTYHQVCINEKKMFEHLFSGKEVSARSCITKGDHLCKWTIKNPYPTTD